MKAISKRKLLCGAVVYITSVFGTNAIAVGQDDEVGKQAGRVKAAVGGLSIKRKPKLVVTLRTLSSMEGAVSSVDDASFTILLKKNPDWDRVRTVAYRDVLALTGSGISLSFVPDPITSPYGNWLSVRSIEQNQHIGIVLASGKEMEGWFGGATDDTFTLLGTTRDAVLELPRTSVVRVFGMTKGGGGYTRKGLRAGTEVGPRESLVAIPVATGIGALIGLAKRKGRSVILVYSR